MAVLVRQAGILFVSLMGAVALLLFSSVAQAVPEVLEACRPDKPTIAATDLPEVLEPGRCPIKDRPIVDHEVGVALPEPGEGVYAEVLTTAGPQELQVTRYENGAVELQQVGDDSGSAAGEQAASDPAPLRTFTAARGPRECRDGAFADLGYRVGQGLSYRFNWRTTPRHLKRAAAVGAVRRGGADVVTTRNTCRLGDRVPAGLVYEGFTPLVANITAGGHCTGNDGVSVVSFGSLPRGTLAVTCIFFTIRPGYDEVSSSDLKVNRRGFRWTTRPDARSCKRMWDLEGVIAHERGHTFGLGHVSESRHGNLTMSVRANGPCQSSERTLGRGDVLGLGNKYR
ncbi:MAG: M10 family metallopeptidase domain-containing protein [Actinomycetota bacterium]|nr:M10 family metallopeptidase domain-containing protein [Actinomycetota bacterium]